MTLKVLISGGGIAGPAAAFWLSRLGHSCTIVERFPEVRTRGQQIDLREQGIEAAERMGLLDEIRKRAVDEDGLLIVDNSGKRQAWVPKESGSTHQSFSSEFEIMRGDLCTLLYDQVHDRVTYRFGVSVSDFQNDEEQVRVTLSDGTVDTYDLLIVADGQGSRIRKQMVERGDISDSSVSLGVFLALFKVPRRPGERNISTSAHAPGRRVMMTRWNAEDEGQGSFITMSHQEELQQALKQDVAEQKAIFAKIFEDAGWEAPRLIEAMNNGEGFHTTELLLRKSDAWSKGRVVLLGDAGYCASPMSGFGTSLALIGAYVLAGEISEREDLTVALEAYEETMRPLVSVVHNMPSRLLKLALPHSALGVKALQWAIWTVTTLKLGELFAKFAVSGEDETWKVPEYPDLKS